MVRSRVIWVVELWTGERWLPVFISYTRDYAREAARQEREAMPQDKFRVVKYSPTVKASLWV